MRLRNIDGAIQATHAKQFVDLNDVLWLEQWRSSG